MSRSVQQSTFEVAGPTGRPQLIDAENFVFWVAAAAVVYSGFHWYQNLTSSVLFQLVPAVNFAAVVTWAIYGSVLLAIIYRHQLFVRRPRSIVAGALLWGGLVATWFGSTANDAVQEILVHGFDFEPGGDWTLAVAAATDEELVKVLGVVVLASLPLIRLRSTLDGLFYGAIIGLGFQVFEDYIYTVQNAFDLTGVASFLIARGIFAGLFAHAVYTAITGAGVGFFVSRRDLSLLVRCGVMFGCFAASWSLHLLWDSPLLADVGGGGPPSMIVKGAPLLLILLLILRAARNSERAIWSSFVDQVIDPSVVSADDAAMLQDHGRRKAALKAAKRAGGHAGRDAERARQTELLRYVQAVAEEGAHSDAAARWRERLAARRAEMQPAT